jgi:hypothetical protein
MYISGAKWNRTVTAAEITAGGKPEFTVGTLGMDYTGKRYKYVQYDTGAGGIAGTAGNVTYYYAPGGVSAGSSTVVTSDLSDSANLGAGVLVAAMGDGDYGWVQIGGVATLTTALTAGADGNALTPVGSTDGTLDVSAAVTDNVCAWAVDASAKIVMCNFPM